MVSSHRNHITSYSDLCSDRSYLGKQLLLLSEQLFLWDTQVLQPGTRLPPLQSDSLAFLQHIFDFRYVWCETKTLKGCGVKAGGESWIDFLWFNIHTRAVEPRRSKYGPALTIDDMLRRYGLLVGLVAYFISFWRYEVYELCATINHKFSGIVSHSYVRKSFLYHLVDGCSGDGEVVVVSRGRSHRSRHMIIKLRNEISGSCPRSGKRYKTIPGPLLSVGFTVNYTGRQNVNTNFNITKRRFTKVS